MMQTSDKVEETLNKYKKKTNKWRELQIRTDKNIWEK